MVRLSGKTGTGILAFSTTCQFAPKRREPVSVLPPDSSRRPTSLAVRSAFALMCWSTVPSYAEAGATDAPNAYKGLVPGQATRQDVTKVLGPPGGEEKHGGTIRYPVAGSSQVTDRLDFSGRAGKLECVQAGSVDSRYPNREAILSKLGAPEAHVRFVTQELLDYSEKGLRFICDASGKTTGVIYFTAGQRRVPAGYPNMFDLRPTSAAAKSVSAPTDFRVGAAEISIAPERFDDVAADAKEKRYSLHEDLFARVAVLQNGNDKMVLIGLDVFGMAPWDVQSLRQSLARQGFSRVLVAMSHTHANVDTIGFYGYYPKAYAQHVVAQAERAVLAAAGNMQPVQVLKMGSVEMPLAGGRVVDLVWNGRNPGLVDPTVSIIQAIGRDGRPIANIIHLACHPEVIRLEDKRELSPDYVGTLCKEVRRELGGQPVFLNGALGGMLTPDAPVRGYESAVAMGKGFAKFVVQAAEVATPSSSYTLWMHRRPVEYPITSEAILKFMKSAPGPTNIAYGRVRTEMNAVWIGDAQMITVPGELLPELGFEIMSHMTGRPRLVLGLTNDEFGYLIPSYDFRAGVYEERTGPGAAGGEITRSVGLELAPLRPH